MKKSDYADRRTAIHLLQSGQSAAATAQQLGRSLAWVYKWRRRFLAEHNWQALRDQSRAPHNRPNQLPDSIRQAIRQARSELEAEADEPGQLSYIGASAIRARLRSKKSSRLPSITSIERVIRSAGMTRRAKPAEAAPIDYPHLHPTQPHQLIQADIVPHYLPGGGCISCFNAIDVISRRPTGHQFTQKRSQEAVDFLIQVWHELGIPDFTQLDNEGCFSGGSSHPVVLGQVVRLGLLVGTQLVFSPVYHPQSNGSVERFHQDYNHNVWDKIDLPDLSAVHKHSKAFFEAYRCSQHHSALDGLSPADVHSAQPTRRLSGGFQLPAKLPVTVGRVHFMRCVDSARQIRVLNLNWDVSAAQPDQGVWATLQIRLSGARLQIYDAAPDAPRRVRLAEHPFPLKEAVEPLADESQQMVEVTDLSWLGLASGLLKSSVAHWVSTMW